METTSTKPLRNQIYRFAHIQAHGMTEGPVFKQYIEVILACSCQWPDDARLLARLAGLRNYPTNQIAFAEQERARRGDGYKTVDGTWTTYTARIAELQAQLDAVNEVLTAINQEFGLSI